jgi:putative FmdB family regulatory protein
VIPSGIKIMPLYEYKCSSCGDVFEIIQKFSDEPLKVHEKCGGAVERLVSTSALQFKGSGWYVNDYGKGSGKEKPKADATNGANKGEKSNGSSSEPAGKTEKSAKSESSTPAASAPSASKSDQK